MDSKAVPDPSALTDGKFASNFDGLALTPRIGVLCLAVLTAIAFFLRVFHLTARSFTLDEGFSIFLTRTSFAQFAQTLWNGELNMGLYYAILRQWVSFSSGEFAIRMLSVIFGVATVAVIYSLGLRLFGRRAAIVATLLMALHPAHIALSQDARSYSLTVLLVSLSSLLFLRTLQQHSWPNWGAYAIVTALAVYSHFFALLVVLAHALALQFASPNKQARRNLVKGWVLLALLLLPIAIFLTHVSRQGLDWVPVLTRRQIVDLLYFLTLSKLRCLTYLLFWAAAIWAAVSLRKRREAAWSYWFVLSWLLVPVSVIIAASVIRPMLVERYLAICIPASVLLAAAGFDYLLDHSRPIGTVALLLLVLYSARSVRFFYMHPEINDDWRGATRYLLTKAHPGDEVFVLPEYARFTVDYYIDAIRPKAPEILITSALPSTSSDLLTGTVWFISSDFPTPGTGEAQVASFKASYGEFCQVTIQRFTTVKVWQFRRCHK